MNGDFGAELDAALNERLGALRDAADQARSRLESAARLLDEAVSPARASGPEEPLDEPPPPEGITAPEENF
ncbi:MAG TPA: hypothetical protein VMF61_11160 [Candidatus Acidoferrales bacterium]|nr:hypothetical protein [Candidatus Acidoferrales bacterium]